MESPRPPDWFLEELKRLDRDLTLEWDWDREAFWLLSVRGEGSRRQVVPYALFGRDELDRVSLTSVAEAIRYRDQGVTIRERLELKRDKRLAREEAAYKEFGDWVEQQATREAEAATTAGKTYASGAPGAPTPGYLGNRVDAVRGE